MDSQSNDFVVKRGMGQGKTILIADDDRTAHIMYEKTLIKSGFEVLHAYDGEEAYDLAKKVCPTILLLDIGMPKMDGRDVCKKLKNDPATEKIIIVMLTGRDTHNDRILGFELGADEYIEKPCYPNYIDRKIGALLPKNNPENGYA